MAPRLNPLRRAAGVRPAVLDEGAGHTRGPFTAGAAPACGAVWGGDVGAQTDSRGRRWDALVTSGQHTHAQASLSRLRGGVASGGCRPKLYKMGLDVVPPPPTHCSEE